MKEMNELASVLLMTLTCVVLLIQLYGRSKLSCARMRVLTTASLAALTCVFVAVEAYEIFTK